MKSLTTSTLQLFLLGALIAVALGMNYLAAWTGPTAAAPNGNVDAPLNVGTTNQVKLASLSVGKETPTASDYGLISYGKIRSTIGGVEFPDGTVQVTAGGGGLKAIRTYTTSGTWTKPAGLSYVIVEVWGGGAGGQAANSVGGTAGGATSFSTFLSATGGTPGSATVLTLGGSGSGGDINLTGGTGGRASFGSADLHAGGTGGDSPRGGAGGPGGYYGSGLAYVGLQGQVPGGGGGGRGAAQGSGAGGGGGGYALKRIDAATLPASVAYTIGAGGTAGASAGAGAAGMVVVYEY